MLNLIPHKVDSFELTPFFCFSVDGENDAFQKTLTTRFHIVINVLVLDIKKTSWM